MFMAALDLANDDVDFFNVTGKFLQILDIGDRGGLEAGRLQCPRMVGVDMTGMDTKGAGFRRGEGHPNLHE
jgi:hypothetical protein